MPDPPATEANREAATAEAAVTAGGAATDAGADTSSDVRSAAVAAAILRARELRTAHESYEKGFTKKVVIGLGRIIALYYHLSTLSHIH
jgi:hypothetical protein